MAEALAALGGLASVLELSKVACSVAQTLYTFCRNTKHVDDNIRELAAEVNSLGNTCAVVHKLLTSLEKEYGTKTDGDDDQYASLWECVGEQVRECKRTIDTLDKSLENIQKEGTSLLAQASRQFKLNWKKDGITDIRSRIKVHMTCLQVTLQSVNIVVSNLAPKRADHELLDKIVALSKDVKDLKKQRTDETKDIDTEVRRSSTAALRLSQETITSGRKLYRESIRSGVFTRSTTVATHMDLQEPHEMHDVPGDDENDDFAFEIADSTAKAAEAAYKRQDWTSTIAYIEELMHGIKRGSFRLSSTPAVPSFDLLHMHAISTFRIDEPAMAQLRLEQAIKQRVTTPDQQYKTYFAQHCLAITYVRLSDLDAANEICKRALNGRRYILGRHNESYFKSLGLMSRIHELQGNQFRAQIYLTMIPEAKVDVMKARYQNLRCPAALDSRPDSASIVPLLSNDLAGLGISSLPRKDASHELELSGPCEPGAEQFGVEQLRSTFRSRPQLFPANTENVATQGSSALSHGGILPLLPSPPLTAVPVFGHRYGSNFHRRNQSAPIGSRTVPGSPLLPSPRALESTSPRARPLGTTGLFRGVNNRTRRAWLAGLNIVSSGEVERAICRGDLMALHAALNKGSELHYSSVSRRGLGRARALHLAALFGDVRMAHTLIMAGCDVHSTVPKISVPGRRLFAQEPLCKSETAMHLAVASRQAPMVEYLLGQGASVYDSRVTLDLPTANLLDIDWLRATQCVSGQEVVDVLRVLVDAAGWDPSRPLGLRGSEPFNVLQSLGSHSNWPFDTTPIVSFCRESAGVENEGSWGGGAVSKTTLDVDVETNLSRNPDPQLQVQHVS